MYINVISISIYIKIPLTETNKSRSKHKNFMKQCIFDDIFCCTVVSACSLHLIRSSFFFSLSISIDDLLFSLNTFLCSHSYVQFDSFNIHYFQCIRYRLLSLSHFHVSSRCRSLLKAWRPHIFTEERFTAIVLWHSFVSLIVLYIYKMKIRR